MPSPTIPASPEPLPPRLLRLALEHPPPLRGTAASLWPSSALPKPMMTSLGPFPSIDKQWCCRALCLVPSAGCNLGCGHPGSDVAHRHAPAADGDRSRDRWRWSAHGQRRKASGRSRDSTVVCPGFGCPGFWLSAVAGVCSAARELLPSTRSAQKSARLGVGSPSGSKCAGQCALPHCLPPQYRAFIASTDSHTAHDASEKHHSHFESLSLRSASASAESVGVRAAGSKTRPCST